MTVNTTLKAWRPCASLMHYFADGDEAIATDIANEIIHQRYQPFSFLQTGRARRGSWYLVS